jgi:hypothetical protein
MEGCARCISHVEEQKGTALKLILDDEADANDLLKLECIECG